MTTKQQIVLSKVFGALTTSGARHYSVEVEDYKTTGTLYIVVTGHGAGLGGFNLYVRENGRKDLWTLATDVTVRGASYAQIATAAAGLN